MTDGLLFYWFSWLLWIYFTFVMKKRKERTVYAFWVLLILCGASVYITILGYKIMLSYLFLAFGAMVMLAKSKHLFYHLFCSLTIMVLYMAIMLWENYFPLWMMLSKTFISPLIIVFIALIIMSKGFYSKVSIILLGISSGELMNSFIMSSYAMKELIGGYVFFDSVLIILFLLIGFEIVYALKVKIRSVFLIYKKSFRVLREE
ncbi:YphA family membrane protein [Virgibacillus necropolis]|uniref:Uncharacterized protein n=1 Tax=Virgibacillus necropolis TaxID=163877 RepID=A0A221MD10_9BACI|nr:hypothetical protein [Virgibacillus necropolis]ASN05500.1 hypothetical protein CFK40_11000 [Virgibacillus necropolis]